MKQELFSVAASRGREDVTIVTSDVDGLKDSISRSGARKSAVELERKSIPVAKSTPGSLRSAYSAEVSWHVKNLQQNEITHNELAPAQAPLKPTPEISQTNIGRDFGGFGY